MTKRKSIASMILFLLISIQVSLPSGCGRTGETSITTVTLGNAASLPGLSPVTFSLLDKSHIETSRGNAHSPFGVIGHNIYQYDGDLSFDGRKATLHTELLPIALFKVANDYFLLTRGPFGFNDESFEWQQLSANVFEKKSIAGVPKALLDVRLHDPKEVAVFRLASIIELLRAGETSTAIEWFNHWVTADPRFVYDPNKEWKNKSRHGSMLNLLEMTRRQKLDDFFKPLVQSLYSSNDDDNPQDVGLLAFTLVALNEVEGKKVVGDFIAKVKAEAGPNATRISDIEWRIK